MDATLCKSINGDEPVEPTTQFPRTAEAVYGVWWSPDLREGQTVRIAWIAEDVGKAAPPNTKIVENKLTVTQKERREPGTFKFHVQVGDLKPAGKSSVVWTGRVKLEPPGGKSWPVGKYRTELYVDDQLMKTLNFTIQ